VNKIQTSNDIAPSGTLSPKRNSYRQKKNCNKGGRNSHVTDWLFVLNNETKFAKCLCESEAKEGGYVGPIKLNYGQRYFVVFIPMQNMTL
jgi:hypothetical protein